MWSLLASMYADWALISSAWTSSRLSSLVVVLSELVDCLFTVVSELIALPSRL